MKVAYSRERGRTGTNFLDANLNRVVPECHDIGGLAYLYHGTFGRHPYFQKR
jgi:hypothetical protein